ncbi:amidase family protein [Mycoplasma leonicaptivi]|uniref:amidase family protein n=1 Tax=Mycoplasma leonicaptivi TaxID=36742 RepID=UPI000488A51E|nr:amidase family protein [Mycoplasma leonicaptivi]
MQRSLKVKGDFKKSIKELILNNNNAISSTFGYFYEKPKNNLLLNATVTIKDNYATKVGYTTASSLLLEKFQPGYNATVVQKLIESGAKIVGKTHLDEFALGGTGTHSAYGLVKNPLDTKRLAGGSSSGAAASLSNNISIALGSDTGDSVRLPASFVGKVGFKPSYGAISRYGLFAYASSLDTVAYFAHNVNDIILTSQVLYGVDSKDMTSKNVNINNVVKTKPKKVIVLNFKNQVNNYVWNAAEELINKIKNQNIEVEIIEPNIDLLKMIKPVYRVISFSEASSNLSNLTGISFGEQVSGNSWNEIIKNTRSQKFGHMVQERLALGSYYLYNENYENIFIKAQKARRLIKNYLSQLQKQGDILIYPASSGIAPKFNEQNKSSNVMDYILTGSNLVGNPSITIPIGKFNNLPFNLAIDSELYSDEKLLGYAEYIEELIGGFNE